VVYTLDDEHRIVHVKEMYWPAGYLNKPLRRLGGSDTQRAALEAFIAGFNAGCFDTVGDYYTEDAVVGFSPDQKLVGKKKIVEWMKDIGQKVNVSFGIESVICDDGGICLTAKETSKALVDAPDFFKPLKSGESLSRLILVVITLKEGLISSSKSVEL